ncbi:hypothetical protein COV82_00015 [Candidatus Peregrinibacteria bacterium CG11_big_fil_rev_8_21_14_0_20_46_8]|nr:MAG: hypothetical protein COV82_00015 [Candidatus Peregrinibacteria bacterium CG11_big_fil_rev_8_21_14_0_20_46_8]
MRNHLLAIPIAISAASINCSEAQTPLPHQKPDTQNTRQQASRTATQANTAYRIQACLEIRDARTFDDMRNELLQRIHAESFEYNDEGQEEGTDDEYDVWMQARKQSAHKAVQEDIDLTNAAIDVLAKLPVTPFLPYLKSSYNFQALAEATITVAAKGVDLCALIQESGADAYYRILLLNSYYNTAERIQNKRQMPENILGQNSDEVAGVLFYLLSQIKPEERDAFVGSWPEIHWRAPAAYRQQRSGADALFALGQVTKNWEAYSAYVHEKYSHHHLDYLLHMGFPIKEIYSDEVIRRIQILGGEPGFYNEKAYRELVKKYGISDFLSAAEILSWNHKMGMGQFLDFYAKSTPLRGLVERVGLIRAVELAIEEVPGFAEEVENCGCSIKFKKGLERIKRPGKSETSTGSHIRVQ